MHRHFPNHKKRNVTMARVLRRRMTDTEMKLWSLLRNNQSNVKFRRQFPFGDNILDFYCHSAKINVEVDGSQHYTNVGIERDENRDAKLEEYGINVLRYSNSDVMEDVDAVVEEIFDEVRQRTSTEAKNNGRRAE